MKISSEVLRGLAMAGLAITAVATPLRQVVYIDQYVHRLSYSHDEELANMPQDTTSLPYPAKT